MRRTLVFESLRIIIPTLEVLGLSTHPKALRIRGKRHPIVGPISVQSRVVDTCQRIRRFDTVLDRDLCDPFRIEDRHHVLQQGSVSRVRHLIIHLRQIAGHHANQAGTAGLAGELGSWPLLIQPVQDLGD